MTQLETLQQQLEAADVEARREEETVLRAVEIRDRAITARVAAKRKYDLCTGRVLYRALSKDNQALMLAGEKSSLSRIRPPLAQRVPYRQAGQAGSYKWTTEGALVRSYLANQEANDALLDATP